MEEICATNPEYQPLASLMAPIHVPTLEKPYGPIHLFTRQIVPSFYQELLN